MTMDTLTVGERTCEHAYRDPWTRRASVARYYVRDSGHVYRVRDGREVQPVDSDGSTWRATDGEGIAGLLGETLDRAGTEYRVIR